jgi:hypothetical protein
LLIYKEAPSQYDSIVPPNATSVTGRRRGSYGGTLYFVALLAIQIPRILAAAISHPATEIEIK